jgi:hypothetical protein
MKFLRTAYAYTGVMAATATMALGSGKALADQDLNGAAPNIGGNANFSTVSNTSGGGLKNTIATIAGTVLDIILLISGILAVFYLVYSGILYITSAGSPDKVKTARAGIINSVIGIIIIVAAFFIIKVALSVGQQAATSTNF